MIQSSNIIKNLIGNNKIEIAVILGSGLENFFEQDQIFNSINYEDLPDFPQPTVKGHSGKLVFGKLNNKNVVCMYGRSHIYEGHEPNSLANPIRVLKDIGCRLLIITNAAGSLDENMPAGSLMVITDHINWSGFNPLIGKNAEEYGPRFNDMSEAYNKYYTQKLIETSQKKEQEIFKGVYCMYSGPNFETPAEIKALKVIGGNAVGMSTVPEVIVANHCSLPVIALSMITNLAAGMNKTKLSHQETLSNAALVEKKIISLLHNYIENIELYDPTRDNKK